MLFILWTENNCHHYIKKIKKWGLLYSEIIIIHTKLMKYVWNYIRYVYMTWLSSFPCLWLSDFYKLFKAFYLQPCVQVMWNKSLQLESDVFWWWCTTMKITGFLDFVHSQIILSVIHHRQNLLVYVTLFFFRYLSHSCFMAIHLRIHCIARRKTMLIRYNQLISPRNLHEGFK